MTDKPMTPREDVEKITLMPDKAAHVAGIYDLPKLQKNWQAVATMLRTLLAERNAALMVIAKYRDALQSCGCKECAAATKETHDA